MPRVKKPATTVKPKPPVIPKPHENPLKPEKKGDPPTPLPEQKWKGETGSAWDLKTAEGRDAKRRYIWGDTTAGDYSHRKTKLSFVYEADLKSALIGGTFVTSLTQYSIYVDVNKAWNKGKECAEKEVSVVQKEQGNNLPGMKTRASNARDSAIASLNSVADCAMVLVYTASPGGLADAIEATSFMYNLSLDLEAKIKSITSAPMEEGDKKPPQTGDPAKEAEKYFNQQSLEHRSTKSERKPQMTWVVTLIDDSLRQYNNPANSDWEHQFWGKVHQLAVGIRGEVVKESTDDMNRSLATWNVSMWWILLPVGLGAGVIAAIRIFAR